MKSSLMYLKILEIKVSIYYTRLERLGPVLALSWDESTLEAEVRQSDEVFSAGLLTLGDYYELARTA